MERPTAVPASHPNLAVSIAPQFAHADHATVATLPLSSSMDGGRQDASGPTPQDMPRRAAAAISDALVSPTSPLVQVTSMITTSTVVTIACV